ncbi:hypothetical protein AAFF_G00396810, partial [Aldrovandia affinis]
GAARFLIKELSHHNLELERSRQVEQDIWPFIVLADDSCVMWNAMDIDGKSGGAAVERNVSLKQVLQHMESMADVTQYGLCGLRKWSSRGGRPGRRREPFSRAHLHDFILINVDLTRDVQYNQSRFTCDDVDFNLRAHSAGLLICRFNNFSVMKKQIAIGGYGTFIIKTKVTDVPTTTLPSQYVCAPDSKHTFLAAPAQLLLEKYLQQSSQHLFPLSSCKAGHPVLSVDCYLNLGPETALRQYQHHWAAVWWPAAVLLQLLRHARIPKEVPLPQRGHAVHDVPRPQLTAPDSCAARAGGPVEVPPAGRVPDRQRQRRQASLLPHGQTHLSSPCDGQTHLSPPSGSPGAGAERDTLTFRKSICANFYLSFLCYNVQYAGLWPRLSKLFVLNFDLQINARGPCFFIFFLNTVWPLIVVIVELTTLFVVTG